MSITEKLAEEFEKRGEEPAIRRVLSDDERKLLDDDVWERYCPDGSHVIARRHGVEPAYVMKRAEKIGALASGEHMLDDDDYRLIEELLKEGLTCDEIAVKFEVKPTLILRIKHVRGVKVRSMRRSLRK